MSEFDRLEAELVRAGRTLVVPPPPDDAAELVLTALRPAPQPGGRRTPGWWLWLRARRRRLIAVVLAAVIIALTLTPPVRAAVVQWLRIGGVVIRTGAPPATSPPSEPPSTAGAMSLEQARASVDFPVGVPLLLGAPERVTVSADRRVVGMDWTVDGRPVHLDQFDGSMSWVYVKQHWTEVTVTAVGGRDAVWLADLHEIVYVDRAGVEHPERARISGPCLVWQPALGGSQTTARLEGVAELATARAVAETLQS